MLWKNELVRDNISLKKLRRSKQITLDEKSKRGLSGRSSVLKIFF
jgi:hypothetical protein